MNRIFVLIDWILGVKYPCDQCDYKAPLPHSLRQHIKTVHEGVKYPCDFCDFKAATNVNLRNHIKTVHDGIKYYCEMCDFRTARVSRLNKHMKTEHSNKMYNNPLWYDKSDNIFKFLWELISLQHSVWTCTK